MATPTNKTAGKVLLVMHDQYGNKHWAFFNNATEAEEWLLNEVGDDGFGETCLETNDDRLDQCVFYLLPVTEKQELELAKAGLKIKTRKTSKL